MVGFGVPAQQFCPRAERDASTHPTKGRAIAYGSLLGGGNARAACSTSPRVRGEVDLRAEPWRREANRVRGLVHKLRPAATPPHPEPFAALGIRPLPARGERWRKWLCLAPQDTNSNAIALLQRGSGAPERRSCGRAIGRTLACVRDTPKDVCETSPCPLRSGHSPCGAPLRPLRHHPGRSARRSPECGLRDRPREPLPPPPSGCLRKTPQIEAGQDVDWNEAGTLSKENRSFSPSRRRKTPAARTTPRHDTRSLIGLRRRTGRDTRACLRVSAMCRLKQFDKIAGRIDEQHLRAARSGHDVVAELYARRAQARDLGGKIIDDEMNPIPAPGPRPFAIAHGSARRTLRPAQQQPQRASPDVSKRGSEIGKKFEAQMPSVPSDRKLDVIDHIADIDGRG